MTLFRHRARHRKHVLAVLGCGLFAVALTVFVKAYWPGFLEPLELWSVDLRFRFRGPLPGSESLVAVDYDDLAARQKGLGRWPWDRRVHAEVIDWLVEAEAKAVLIDILFDYPSREPDRDSVLAASVSRAGNVFLPLALHPHRQDAITDTGHLFRKGHLLNIREDGGVGKIPHAGEMFLPLAELVESAAGMGHILRSLDSDGVLRRIPLLYSVKGGFLPSLSLAAAFRHLDADPNSVRVTRGQSISFKTGSGKSVVIPIDEQGRTWINYAGPWGQQFVHYPYSWLLSQVKTEQDRDKLKRWFEGKTVVLANLTTGSSDQGTVPFDKFFPYSEVLLHILNMLSSGQFLRDSNTLESLASIALPVTFLTFAGMAGGPGLLIPAFLIVSAGYVAMLYYAFISGVILPGIYPFFALFIGLTLLMVTRFFIVDRERYRFQSALGACLPPQTVQQIQRSPTRISELLKSRRRELSVLFADIRGFTDYCQRTDPMEIQRILDDYLGSMTEVLRSHGGTIDKYMGDGIMAFFGDAEPEDGDANREEERVERNAAAAVRAGLAMQSKMVELNEKWESQGRETHLIRVGINTGPVTVGKMGTEYLWDYTVVGSEVNKAQRLESGAPPGGLLIARRTFVLARKHNVVPSDLQPQPTTLKSLGEQTDLYPIPPDLVAEVIAKSN